MSINIGKIISENLNDNRLKIGTYNNSNVININTDVDNYKDAGINFKNKYFIGYSNFNFTINSSLNNSNLININETKSQILNDLFVKTNINTSNDTTFIYSNLIVKLTSNNINAFQIHDSNNNNILNIQNNYLGININNSNKLFINSNGINITDTITISSNKELYVSTIKSSISNMPTVIDYAIFNKFDIKNYNIKEGITVINDTIVPNPSIYINRYYIDCNIIEILNKNNITNTSFQVFSINKDGYIGIGSNNSKHPLDINLNIPIHSNIIYYNNINNSNYKFNVNSRGYIGIGTNYAENQIDIHINDDSNNINNPPIINLDLSYNKNNNYRTSNLIDLRFIASKDYKYYYNDEDTIISSNLETNENFICSFTSNINEVPASLLPTPANRKVVVSVINKINNDYIDKNKISSIIPYNTCNYLPYSFTINDTDYNINYTIGYITNIFKLDPNEIIINGQRTNPVYTQENNNHNISFTSYIIKSTTQKPYYDSNLILKEVSVPIYNINPLITNDYLININQRLYIEKGIYELKSFKDTLTYMYKSPSDFLYGTSNNNFSVSLTSEGKLALGDMPPLSLNNYYLYVQKKSRLEQLEVLNISSIEGKNNINFSYCNISNINKIFATSNTLKVLNAEFANVSNINISNISARNLNVDDIKIKNLSYEKITGSNLTITSNLIHATNIQILMGNEGHSRINENKFYMNIHVNSNLNKGLNIASYSSNLNPSLAISGYSNNNYPILIFNNQSSSYSLQVNSNNKSYLLYDNFSLIDNNNNRTVFKHVNYDNTNNQFIFGTNNNIIFDLKPEEIPTNTTNKISLGYPYRYLVQNGLNINNWENHFKTNVLNTDCMLNVYGNINLSSINNTSFIKCIASEFPNETIGVGIGTNPKPSFLLSVGGLSYFSSNINVEKDVFIKGTIGNVSDIRVKEDLKIIKEALIKIGNLNGYIYKRKDTGRIETGLIAQEVLKVLPEVIFETDGKYNVSYGNMCGLLIEGIKELNTKIKIIECILMFMLGFLSYISIRNIII